MRFSLTRGALASFTSIAAPRSSSTPRGLEYSGPTGYPRGAVHTGARYLDSRVLAFTVGSVVTLVIYALVLAAIWWSAAEADTGPEPGGVFVVERG